MKKLLTRLVKLIALIVPIVLVVVFSQQYLFFYDDFNARRVRGFYNETPNSMDVVVMGASEVFSGYSPAHAYSYGGYTSYLYCAEGVTGSLYLPTLKEIRSRQSPQVVVVEINGFVHEDEYQFNESRLHLFLDNIPFSMNKVRTALEHSYADPISSLIPFIKYHGQWQMTPAEAQDRYEKRVFYRDHVSRLKGIHAQLQWDKEENFARDLAQNDTVAPLSPLADKYLREFLEYCREVGQDVVLTRFPHKLNSEEDDLRFARGNRIAQIAEEYGVTYLPLERMADDEILIDPMEDYADPEHLGFSGMIKLTEYLADWLIYDYGLEPMEQTPENASDWENCVLYSDALNERAWAHADARKPLSQMETPALLAKLEEHIQQWYEGDE